MTLEEDCELQIVGDKIYLNCLDKISTYSTSSKNPQKAMIARIQSILPNYQRAEVSKFVKTWFFRNNPSDACPNLEEQLREAKRTILYQQEIIKKLAEHNRNQEERIFNLEHPVLPLENENPFN